MAYIILHNTAYFFEIVIIFMRHVSIFDVS